MWDLHTFVPRTATSVFVLLLCSACTGESHNTSDLVLPLADHHIHVLSPELVQDWKALGVPFSRADTAYTSISAILADTTVRAFLISMAHIYGSSEFRSALNLSSDAELRRVQQTNDHVAGEVARNRSKYVGFCSVPLLRPYALVELQRCRDELHLAGIKLHLPASGVNLTVPEHLRAVATVAALASDEQRPLFVHLAPVEGELSDSELQAFIEHVVEPNPELKLYLAHLGGNGGYRISAQRSIQAFTDLLHRDAANTQRTIYFELSGGLLTRRTDGVPASSSVDAHQLATDLRALGLERVLFGSDYPVFDPREFWAALNELLPLTSTELAQVMRNTAPAFEE